MKRIIPITLIIVLVLSMGNLTFAQNINKDINALEYLAFTEEEIGNMPEETRKLYEEFIVKDTTIEYKFFVEEIETGELVEITQEEFYRDVIDTDCKVDVEIAVKNALENESISMSNNTINASRASISTPSDTASCSWATHKTTLLEGTGADYCIVNEVWSSTPFLLKQHITGIGVGSNSSIVANSEFMFHKYDFYSDQLVYLNSYTDWYYDASSVASTGYGFDYSTVSNMRQNYTKMAAQAVFNNSNATVFDGYGHYAETTVSIDPSFSISGADLSVSWQWRETGGTHVQDRN